jgi:hypothetical protein
LRQRQRDERQNPELITSRQTGHPILYSSAHFVARDVTEVTCPPAEPLAAMATPMAKGAVQGEEALQKIKSRLVPHAMEFFAHSR